MGNPFFGERRYLDTDKARELYDIGYCDQQIADICNVSREAVSTWRRRNGLVGHSVLYKAVEEKRESTLIELAIEARKHGMTYGQYQVAKKEGWL